MNRKTKIIATIGPASWSAAVMRALARGGADIFRFNLKHGPISEHRNIIKTARKIMGEQGRRPKIMIDLPKYDFKAGFDLARELRPEHLVLSHINKAAEIDYARKILEQEKIKTNIVTKIETDKALRNFAAILASSDAVMVGRGDLGRSIRLEYVPFVQKEIIQSCNKHKKFVIVATEMLLSMTENKQPTRAEAGDVANAVIEGADAVMLSEESAIGKNPLAAVLIMDKILRQAEHWKKTDHIRILAKSKKRFYFGRD